MAKTKVLDVADYLDGPKAISEYLTEAFQTGDAAFITKAIGAVARAQGMTEVAREAGVSRENLYRALGSGAKPEFETVMKVLKAMNIQLVAQPKSA